MAANRGPAALQSLGLEQRDPPLSTPETLPTQHNLTPSTAGTKRKRKMDQALETHPGPGITNSRKRQDQCRLRRWSPKCNMAA